MHNIHIITFLFITTFVKLFTRNTETPVRSGESGVNNSSRKGATLATSPTTTPTHTVTHTVDLEAHKPRGTYADDLRLVRQKTPQTNQSTLVSDPPTTQISGDLASGPTALPCLGRLAQSTTLTERPSAGHNLPAATIHRTTHQLEPIQQHKFPRDRWPTDATGRNVNTYPASTRGIVHQILCLLNWLQNSTSPAPHSATELQELSPDTDLQNSTASPHGPGTDNRGDFNNSHNSDLIINENDDHLKAGENNVVKLIRSKRSTSDQLHVDRKHNKTWKQLFSRFKLHQKHPVADVGDDKRGLYGSTTDKHPDNAISQLGGANEIPHPSTNGGLISAVRGVWGTAANHLDPVIREASYNVLNNSRPTEQSSYSTPNNNNNNEHSFTPSARQPQQTPVDTTGARDLHLGITPSEDFTATTGSILESPGTSTDVKDIPHIAVIKDSTRRSTESGTDEGVNGKVSEHPGAHHPGVNDGVRVLALHHTSSELHASHGSHKPAWVHHDSPNEGAYYNVVIKRNKNLVPVKVIHADSGSSMVYVVHAAEAETHGTDMDYVHDGVIGSIQNIVIAVCATVSCMVTVCALITFTHCCCRRRGKDDSSDDEVVAEDGNAVALATMPGQRGSWSRENQGSRPASWTNNTPSNSLQNVSVEGHPLDLEVNHGTSEDSRPALDPSNVLSVQDRIKAFETKTDHRRDVQLRDASKPRRKKPKSRAFEEFESQGILIGFGGAPKKHTAESASAEDFTFGRSDDADVVTTPERVSCGYPIDETGYPFIQTTTRISNRRSNRNGEISVEHDDEFAAVQRNSDMLKSFRRAPPPKNRTRARRSGRQRPNIRQEMPVSNRGMRIEEELVSRTGSIHSSARPYTADEADLFEQSLHMPNSPTSTKSLTNTPQTNARMYRRTRSDIINGTCDESMSDSDDTQDGYEVFDVPRRRSQSESGRRHRRSPPPPPTSYQSSQGLPHDTSCDQSHDQETSFYTQHSATLANPRLLVERERERLSELSGAPLSRNYSSPVVRVSPLQRRSESPLPSEMRRWGSDGMPRTMDGHRDVYNIRQPDNRESRGYYNSPHPQHVQFQHHPQFQPNLQHQQQEQQQQQQHQQLPPLRHQNQSLRRDQARPHSSYQPPSYPHTDKLERKFRTGDFHEEERVYPNSEKLTRKVLLNASAGGSAGAGAAGAAVCSPDSPPHNLLYRPMFATTNPIYNNGCHGAQHQVGNSCHGNHHPIQHLNGAIHTEFANTRVVVKFNIDTEPTSV